MYIIFIIEQIQQKLMTKFFNKFRKPCFGPILVAKQLFLENLTLSSTWYNSKKTPGQTKQLKDGQILFQRTLPAAAVGQRAFNMK